MAVTLTFAAPAGWVATAGKLGAGGFTVNGGVSDDGATIVCNVDVYGAYLYDRDADFWINLFTDDRLPVELRGREKYHNAGPMICAVAPSNPNRLWTALSIKEEALPSKSYILRSDDRGTSWQLTSFLVTTAQFAELFNGNNTATRQYQPQGGVDPFNPDVFIVSTISYGATSGSLWLTTNGGTTWTDMVANGLPRGYSNSVYTGIVFDRASLSSGRCQTIYVCVWGNGIWRTTNGGTSWALVAGSTGFPKVSGAAQSRVDNKIYFANDFSTTCGKVVAGVFSTFFCPAQAWTIVPSTVSATRLCALNANGAIFISQDSGATWTGNLAYTGEGHPGVASPQCLWHQTSTNYGNISLANAFADPLDDRIIAVAGTGNYWTSDPISSSSAMWVPSAWVWRTRGIEDMATNPITAVPGGGWLITMWDRPLFIRTTTELINEYPAGYDGPNWQNYGIIHGYSADYASSDPTFIVAVITIVGPLDYSGYRSGGIWHQFATIPPWQGGGNMTGGSIAASTPLNIIWQPTNTNTAGPPYRIPYYTLDGGATWSPIALPAPASNITGGNLGLSGAGGAPWHKRKSIAACRVRANTFMLFIFAEGSDAANNRGCYLTTNGGVTWTRRNTNHIFGAAADAYNGFLQSVPGKSGHWWWTCGDVGGDVAGGLAFSIDDAATWTYLTDVKECTAYGLGAQAPGGSYPRLWLAGWVGGTTDADYGIWYTDNATAATPTFVRAMEFPLTLHDSVIACTGHPDTHEECLLGYGGSSVVLITRGDPTPPPPAAPVLGSGLRLTPTPVANDVVEMEVYSDVGLTTRIGYDMQVIETTPEGLTYNFNNLPERTIGVTYYFRSRTLGDTWSNTLTRVEPPPDPVDMVTAPTLSGTPMAFVSYPATPGTATGAAPITYTWQWKAAGVNAAGVGATGSGETPPSYVPTVDDVGKTLTLTQTGTNLNPSSDNITSAASAAVAANPALTPVYIGGTANNTTQFNAHSTDHGPFTLGTPAAGRLIVAYVDYQSGIQPDTVSIVGDSTTIAMTKRNERYDTGGLALSLWTAVDTANTTATIRIATSSHAFAENVFLAKLSSGTYLSAQNAGFESGAVAPTFTNPTNGVTFLAIQTAGYNDTTVPATNLTFLSTVFVSAGSNSVMASHMFGFNNSPGSQTPSWDPAGNSHYASITIAP